MTISSKAFLTEIHTIINKDSESVISVILNQSSKEQTCLAGLSDDQVKGLQSLSLDEDQVSVLRKALKNMAVSIVSGMLCIVDGVAYTTEPVPDLALVNRDTGCPINEDFLHDEFFEIMPGNSLTD